MFTLDHSSLSFCLQEMSLFDWATMPVPSFAGKLATAWLGFFITLGLPVSAFTFDLHKELLQCLTAASAGSSFIVTVLVWRLYLGWQVGGNNNQCNKHETINETNMKN
jgi:hypothetical protein